MSNLIVNKKYIENALQANRFAILATEGKGQPHMSLIAITPVAGFHKLIFSTYRNTVKYSNLSENGKVAVLIENGNCKNLSLQGNFILTAFGHAEEIRVGNDLMLQSHLERHPEMKSFIQSEECALIQITINAFQLVLGIEDVHWYSLDDLDSI
jgi:uncharacterized pyridoxamine 5'-phosphate oxidase family protein